MKRLVILVFFIFLIANVCAHCEEGQIDINSASASELEKLDGVGEKIAQYIIDKRPFDDVDDLIDVYRIGEITLEKIKDQGLACVGDNDDEEEKEEQDEKKEVAENSVYFAEEENETHEKTVEIKTGQVINLAPQNIKGNDNWKSLDKGDYAVYGFVAFSILLCLLFVLKWRKGKDEIE